jgi:hypothetical protein
MPQIKRLRIRNLLTYEDSGWIELGRRTLIVGPNGSGKTNTIRALRLMRAAVGLEDIQPANVIDYLHDPSKPLAGIDLDVTLADEEVEAAYDLLRYYRVGGVGIGNVKYIAQLYDFGEHASELKELLRNACISMSWARKQDVAPSKHTMYGYHELAFPALHLRLLLKEGSEFYSGMSDYGFAYYDPDSWDKLPAERWVSSGISAACDKKQLLEKLLDNLKVSGGEEREKALKDVMYSCMKESFAVSDNIVPAEINKEEIQPFIRKIFEMANISQPDLKIEYGMGYLLLRIILGGLLFAGSEKPFSGVSKLAALRGSFYNMELVMNEDFNKILDEVGASSVRLDAYLRNVEPFLAHLSLSSDSVERQRFREISDCFSKYFHNIREVEVASEQFEVRLRPCPALLQPETKSPMDKVWSELLTESQCLIKLPYHRIYLREKVGTSERPTPLDMAAQGHRELLSLLTALIGRPGSVVFLDEPASNMNPTLLSQFLMDLMGHSEGSRKLECSKELGRNQIIVITHSPVVAKIFMEADVGASDLSIISVHRVSDGASKIGYLTPDKWQGGKEEFLKTIGRIVDPRILFAKGVVLCEGPADHAFLREALGLLNNSEKWNELLRNDVELVWMNSKNNLVTYDKVLNQLEIPYVAVLDFDALCEVLLCKNKNELEDHPLYKACNNKKGNDKKVLILTPNKLKELNDSDKLSGYRYVLLLNSYRVPVQLDCNDSSALKSVLLKICNKCIDKDHNCKKKKNSKKCELEGFLEGLKMDLSGCKDDNGKLKPESVPECVVRQNEEVKGKIKQMGNILSKLIDANILGGSTDAMASY